MGSVNKKIKRKKKKMEGPSKANSRNVENNGRNEPSNSPLDVKDVDVELLPLVHDIVRALEKESNDHGQRTRDSLEASQKIIELNKKVEKVREDIYRLPGIEAGKEEQLAKMQNLRQQLKMKKDLIAKYKELNLKVNGLSGLHQAN